MALVVLLRGANVGGKRFSPKAVEAELADLDAASIGAAGTFVVRGRAAAGPLAKRVQALLPFECEAIVLDAREVRAAMEAGGRLQAPEGAKRFATAMAAAPKAVPLPIEAPEGGGWGVRVEAVAGRVALGLRRSVAATGVYPNEVVEKAFHATATTRDWPTMEKIAQLL